MILIDRFFPADVRTLVRGPLHRQLIAAMGPLATFDDLVRSPGRVTKRLMNSFENRMFLTPWFRRVPRVQ